MSLACRPTTVYQVVRAKLVIIRVMPVIRQATLQVACSHANHQMSHMQWWPSSDEWWHTCHRMSHALSCPRHAHCRTSYSPSYSSHARCWTSQAPGCLNHAATEQVMLEIARATFPIRQATLQTAKVMLTISRAKLNALLKYPLRTSGCHGLPLYFTFILFI